MKYKVKKFLNVYRDFNIFLLYNHLLRFNYDIWNQFQVIVKFLSNHDDLVVTSKSFINLIVKAHKYMGMQIGQG